MYHSSRGLSWQQKEEPETEEAVETTTWWDRGRAAEVARKQLKSCLEQWIRGNGDDGKGILELPSLEAGDWSRNCWHCWGPRAPAPSLIAGSLVGTKGGATNRCSWEPKTATRAECWAVDRQKNPGSELHAERLKHEFLAPKTFTSHQGLEAVGPARKPWGLEVRGLPTAEEPYSWFPVRMSAAGKKLIWIRTKVLSQVPSQVPRCCIALVSSTLDFLNVLDLFALKD